MLSKSLAAILSLTLGLVIPAAAQDRGDCQGLQAESWSIEIAGPDEPGERLVVDGRVLTAGGEPVAGATVFVFHTDAEGYYSPGGMDEGDARLCGLMLTDAEGRYRYATIRPVHYATGGGPPAHVHYRVSGASIEPQSFTLHFADDPLLGARDDGTEAPASWARVRPVEVGDDGEQRVVRDLLLR